MYNTGIKKLITPTKIIINSELLPIVKDKIPIQIKNEIKHFKINPKIIPPFLQNNYKKT